jgi:phosphatidylserine/phosphatidylglycerophosphate/cardiolipin synthase-like enzyme
MATPVNARASPDIPARHAWAHEKVMTLDGAIVITGSYHWTVAAEQENGENFLMIRDL